MIIAPSTIKVTIAIRNERMSKTTKSPIPKFTKLLRSEPDIVAEFRKLCPSGKRLVNPEVTAVEPNPKTFVTI